MQNKLKSKNNSRKFYGIQTIEQKLSNLLKPIFNGEKKEFILINSLVKSWEEIVGKKYAVFCYPKAVQFDKSNKSAKLTVAVYNSTIGFFLENNSEIILERIAICYGFKSITKIIIKQEPKDIKLQNHEEIKLTTQQSKNLESNLLNVADENLAKTLHQLGKEILKK